MRERLDNIYYRFYRFQVSVGNSGVAVTFSLIFLSFLLLINLFSIFFILHGFLEIKMPFHNAIDGLITVGVIILINYFLFIYRERYKAIIKNHKNESTKNVRNGNIKVIAYIVLSFIMIIVGFYLMIMRNRALL